jgi:hypothetical protein
MPGARSLPTSRLLVAKTSLTVGWMSAVVLGHIFVLGYGWFFVDALMVMVRGCHLFLADTQAFPLGRTRKGGDDGCLTNAQKIIGRLLEEATIRPDVATVYALQDAAHAWKDIVEKLPRVHGMSPSEPRTPRRKKHGKIVVRVA